MTLVDAIMVVFNASEDKNVVWWSGWVSELPVLPWTI